MVDAPSILKTLNMYKYENIKYFEATSFNYD